jgi:hypothetical protein
MSDSQPGSTEREAAEEQLRLLDKRRLKRQPTDRHKKRMSALYVDLADDDTWSKPSDLDPDDCKGEVVIANLDYIDARAHIHEDRSIATAVASLVRPPTFPPTQWPS